MQTFNLPPRNPMALTKATVEAAIEAIQTNGQSVSFDGVLYSAASLSTLISLRDKLAREEAATASTRPTFRAFNFGSMGYSE